MTMGKGVAGRTLGALFAVALAICFYYPCTWARDPDPGPPSQGEQIGEIKRILGTAFIRRAGEGRPQPARENAPVFLQDTLGTDRASKAWWRSGTQGAASQADASLGEGSALEFIRFDRDATSSVFSGEVGQGMVRFIKDLPQSVPLSHFIISTPTAVIEVMSTDRPADFVVEVREDQKLTTVYGIWGAVRVIHISAQFVQERIVRSCQRVDVEENKEPGPVIGVSPETLKDLIRKTTIPNTLPEEVPSCRDEAVVVPTEIVECPCPHGQELVGGVCAECPRWKTYHRHGCSCVSRCRHDNQCRRCETCRNGLCVPKVCPPGQWLDEKTCTCMRGCPPIDCPQGFWFNPRTCRCERRPCDKKCPPGQKLDLKTCTCVGECTPIECKEGFWFNPKTCQCECRDKKCPPGQKLDLKTCTCVGECTPVECKEGFWFNPKTCQCECRDKKCPPGQTLDKKTCTCVGDCRPIHCQEGFWFDPKTCRCERKPCDKKCPPGQVLDSRTCECTQRPPDCRRKCPPGQHLDLAACRCVGDGTVPKEGCKSDGECGPGSVCRDHRCVPKEGHVDKPSQQKPERPVLPAQPSQQKPERPVLPAQPSKQKQEHPALPAQPSQQKQEHPALPAQPR